MSVADIWARYGELGKEERPEYPVIHKSDLSTPDGRRSREVSHEEFQEIAHRGARAYQKMLRGHQRTDGIEEPSWSAVKDHAFHETRHPWGGATYNTRTGAPMTGASGDLYSLSVRGPHESPVSVHPDASREEFHHAMDAARDKYHHLLKTRNHHLGVFHDADEKRIDIDPVIMAHNLKGVEELGAYHHSVGGAYHFNSGDGFWPPHVKDEHRPGE